MTVKVWPHLLGMLTLFLVIFIPATAQSNEDSHAVIFMYSHIGVSKYPNTNISIKQFSAHLNY